MSKAAHVWSWDKRNECYWCHKCLMEVKHQTSKYWNTKCEESVELDFEKTPHDKAKKPL